MFPPSHRRLRKSCKRPSRTRGSLPTHASLSIAAPTRTTSTTPVSLWSLPANPLHHRRRDCIARLPCPSFSTNKHDLFITIDATTKSTCLDLPPAVTVALDLLLLVFNQQHPLCAAIRGTGVRVNECLSDASIHKAIVILGVAVKSSIGGGMDAEYQLGVWGMRALHLMRSLRKSSSLRSREYVIGLSVRAHVWSYHVTYWRGDGIVTHGHVCIGATDTLYRTMKIVAFVRRFKQWAVTLLSDWTVLVSWVGEKGGEGAGGYRLIRRVVQ